MKKTTLIILTIALILLPFASYNNIQNANADEVLNSTYLTNIEKYYTELDTTMNDRGIGTGENLEFKEYLQGNLGVEFRSSTFTYQEQSSDYLSTETKNGCNYIYTKKGLLDDRIVIFANYNNWRAYTNRFNSNNTSSGSSETSTGMVTLMSIIERVKDIQLEYTIDFVFVSESETDYVGADYYLSNQNPIDIKLVINLNSPVGGEKAYVYTSENDVEFAQFLVQDSALLNLPPKDKKSSLSENSNYGYPYTHVGMTGANASAARLGIPTVNYISLNWEGALGVTEYAGKPNVRVTTNDTLAKLLENCPEIYSITDQLANSIANVLQKSDLDEKVASYKEQISNKGFFANSKTLTILKWLVYGVVITVFIIMLVYFNKHRETNDPKPTDTKYDRNDDINDPFNLGNKDNSSSKEPDIFEGF